MGLERKGFFMPFVREQSGGTSNEDVYCYLTSSSTSSSATLNVTTQTPGTSCTLDGNNRVYAVYIKPTRSASLHIQSRGNSHFWLIYSVNGVISWERISTSVTKSLDSSYDFVLLFHANVGTDGCNVTYTVS